VKLIHEETDARGEDKGVRNHFLGPGTWRRRMRPGMVPVCIQDPSATDGETHVRGYANSRSSGADR
jgi:hypothetical protein